MQAGVWQILVTLASPHFFFPSHFNFVLSGLKVHSRKSPGDREGCLPRLVSPALQEALRLGKGDI